PIPRQPSSTLFPYTTLFRSTIILHGPTQRNFAKGLIDKAPAGAVLTIREANRSVDQNSKLWAMLSDVSRSMPDGRRHTAEVWKTDRKSTRLNSSHVKISYAV